MVRKALVVGTLWIVALVVGGTPAWALPWQSERWHWSASQEVVLEDSTSRAHMRFDRSAWSSNVVGLERLDLHVASSARLHWQVEAQGGEADQLFVVWAELRCGPWRRQVPLLRAPGSQDDGLTPAWERRAPVDAPFVADGHLDIGPGPVELRVKIGVRSLDQRLAELRAQVPGIAHRLLDELARGDGQVDGLRSDLATATATIEELRADVRRLRNQDGSGDQPPGGVTFNLMGAQEETERQPETLAANLSVFQTLYTAPAETAASEERRSGVDALLEGSRRAIRPMIATLPDPVDSRFAREFDLMIAALRAAAEANGYLFDRQYFPWLEPESGRFRTEPGVLLFRARGKNVPHLAIFLVGELPNAGVHVQALRAALDRATELKLETAGVAACLKASRSGPRAAHPSPPAEPTAARVVDVLGPTFSGSRAALRHVLHEWGADQPEAVCARVVSGSASVEDNECFFEAPPGSAPLSIAYRSMAVNDREARRELLAYLARIGIKHEAVRLLTESSLYGATFGGEKETPLAEACRPPEGKSVPTLRTVRFPMHIAQLRSDLAAREASTRGEMPVLGQRHPFVQLGDYGPGKADPRRPLAPGLTSPSENVVLASLIRELATKRVEAVGIIASDVQDKIFLAKQLRRHAPNIRLFTLEGDVLLAHPEAAESTRGMLVVSSHRLHEGESDDARNDGDEARMLRRFANDWSHGLYLAARALVGRSKDLLDGQGARGHPVWVSVVGHGAMQVVAQRDRQANDLIGEPSPSDNEEQVAVAMPNGASLAPRCAGWSPCHLFRLTGPLTSITATLGAVMWGHDRPEIDAWLPPRGWTLALAALLVGLAVVANDAKRWSWPVAGTSTSIRLRHLFGGNRDWAALANTGWTKALVDLRLLLGLLSGGLAFLLFLLAAPYLAADTSETGGWGPMIVGVLLSVSLILVLLLFVVAAWMATRQLSWTAEEWAREEALRGDQMTDDRLVSPDSTPAGPSAGEETRVGPAGSDEEQRGWAVRYLGPSLRAWLSFVFVWTVVFFFGDATWRILIRSSEELKWIFARALQLGNGVSPLMPSIVLVAVPIAWLVLGLMQYRRLADLGLVAEPRDEDENEGDPAPKRKASKLPVLTQQLVEAVDPAQIRLHWLHLVAIGLPTVYLMLYFDLDGRLIRSLESQVYDYVATFLLILGLTLGISSLVQARSGWRAFRELVGLSDGLRSEAFGTPASKGDDTSLSEAEWQQLAADAERLTNRTQDRVEQRNRAHKALAGQLDRASFEHDGDASEAPQLSRAWLRLIVALDDLPPNARKRLLRRGRRPEVENGPIVKVGPVAGYVFVELAIYLRSVGRQLRRRLYLGVGILLALFISLTVYPFQPHRPLVLWSGVLVAWAAVLSVQILTGMERQSMIRWAEQHRAQWLDRGFLQSVTLSGGLPAASLLATYVPALRGLLFDWIQPLLKMMS